jgi:GT2 family glycosyltransferase/glycosyltransferase involved in cell wall biosynthesis
MASSDPVVLMVPSRSAAGAPKSAPDAEPDMVRNDRPPEGIVSNVTELPTAKVAETEAAPERAARRIPFYVFDRQFYVDRYVDIGELLRQNPGFDVEGHFWDHGADEGRVPSLAFNPHHVGHRLARLLGIRVTGRAAIEAYFDLPEGERFIPNGWFNPWSFKQLYRQQFRQIQTLFPDIEERNDYQTFIFYLENVYAQRIAPNGLFSEEEYRAAHPDVATAIAHGQITSGFHHFATRNPPQPGTLPDYDPQPLGYGGPWVAEQNVVLSDHADIGRSLWWYDESFYLTIYPDVHAMKRQGIIRSGLEHFMVRGDREGRLPHPALTALATRKREISLRAALADMPHDIAKIGLDVAAATAKLLRGQPYTAPPRIIDEALWRWVSPPAVDCTIDPLAYLKANPDLAGHVAVHEAAAHWRAFGLIEQRLVPGTNIFANRTLHLEDLGRYRPGGVNLFGPLSIASGLGAAARGYRDAMRAAGITVDEYDVAGATQPGKGFDLFDPAALRFGHNFICLNPDHIATLLDRYGSALFDRRVNIGAWVWEMPVARPEWNAVLGGFDLVVTPSDFCRSAFAAVTSRPIETIPYVVDRAALLARREQADTSVWLDRIERARSSGRRESDRPRTVVLFVMDASSYTARKGIDIFRAVATRMAAEAPGQFLFVLKTHSRDASARAASDIPPDTLVIDAVLDTAELIALKSSVDLYFSPHRSEGFGLNIFESLALGVPALISSHAGAPELLGEDYPLLIPGKPCEVGEERGPYRAHAIWFEPDVDAIVTALHAFPKRDTAAKSAMAETCARVAARLSAEAVGAALRRMLTERCAFDLDVSGFMPVIASPRDEFQALPQVMESRTESHRIAEDLVRPAFSVITPTYNTDPAWLEDLYADLAAQTCPSWEWCIADDGSTNPATIAALHDLRRRDCRIRVSFTRRNGGISAASNRAVMLSSAPYVVMVDHDDRLAPGLLAAYLARTARPAPPDVLYCDEDKILADGRRGDHFFKPDFAPEHLMSVMYVLHCLCIRKAHFLELGGYRTAFDGAQDHDFALRAASAGASFAHVSAALYHWRAVASSTASSVAAKPTADNAGRRAVAEHLERLGVKGVVEPGAFTGSYRVRPQLPDEPVTLLMLTRFAQGPAGTKRVCYAEHFIDSILAHDPGAPFRLTLVIDEGGEAMASVLAKRDKRIDVLVHRREGAPFNFAAKANFAVRAAPTERVVLLNDDMEALDDGWLAAILEPLELPGVGITGGRLLYADDTVQHAGIVLGLHGAAGHLFAGSTDDYIGYNGFTHIMRNYSAVTGAFMAFRRRLFDAIGGFDERYPIDYNDVDFCLRGLEAGERVVYTPFARLRHFESRSAPRNSADTVDTARFAARWASVIERDPYYNPNLSRHSTLCEPAVA